MVASRNDHVAFLHARMLEERDLESQCEQVHGNKRRDAVVALTIAALATALQALLQ